MLDNCSHLIVLEVDTLIWTKTMIDEPKEEIFDLIVTKELEESSSSLFEDIRVSSKFDLLIEEPYKRSILFGFYQ